jgi:hypothetical protein
MTIAKPMQKEDVPASQPREEYDPANGSRDDEGQKGDADDENYVPPGEGLSKRQALEAPASPSRKSPRHQSQKPTGQSCSLGLDSPLRILSLKALQLGE